MDADLIIIGGGLAGLTTANRALELGLRPIVLEKGKEADYPCNSRYSGGLFHVAFKDVTKPVEDIEAAIKASGDPIPPHPGSDNVQNIMSEDAAKALAWLRQERGKFIKGGQPEFMRWMLAPPRPRGAGLDWKGRGPDVLLRRLTEALQKAQAAPRLGWRAIEPIIENNCLSGIIAEGPNGKETIRAPAVVIADGGFQANMELMQRYISPNPEALLQRGGGTGIGDGLKIAETAGAALVGLDSFYGHLLGRDAIQNPKLWPYPVVD
ncbi:MAG: FAD-dependent oxidoreductase, partial [Rhodospirillales bacterium]